MVGCWHGNGEGKGTGMGVEVTRWLAGGHMYVCTGGVANSILDMDKGWDVCTVDSTVQ